MKKLARCLAAAAAVAALSVATARGDRIRRDYRLVRVNDAKASSHAPGPFLTAPRRCTPDVAPIPGVTVSLAPDLLGSVFDPTDPAFDRSAFDPSKWDEISVAGDGRILAYATSVSAAGVPGGAKQIALQGVPVGAASRRIDQVETEDDQPCARYDAFGFRCAFRSGGASGAAPSNIQLHTTTNGAGAAAPATVAVTANTGTDVAFDPALAAYVRRRNAGGGIHVRERDARIAFVSTGDHAGQNPDGLQQLFLWEEIGKTFTQITRNTEAGTRVNRPTLAAGGDVIVFESTANLVPASVDPGDTSRVGNASHVRQLFRWRRGRPLEQITWSDGDCFSPRFDPTGRVVIFSCRGDPITGGNPERNLEIFEWTASARPALRLRQMTQTKSGANVFPRPTSRRDVFVFYSTSHPASGSDAFGVGKQQCTPRAMLYARGKITVVDGVLDQDNALRLIPSRSAGQQTPVIVGPPAVGADALRIYLVTNDFALNASPGDDSTSATALFVAVFTRHSPR